MNTLSELAKVKAIFQQRAICAALGIMGGQLDKRGNALVGTTPIQNASAHLPTKESE